MIRKRTRSVGDDLYPQCKSHIGEKEVNFGVNKDENMKIVYARTLDKLFKGSQKKTNGDVEITSAHLQAVECTHYKQMFLNNKCEIQAQGNVKNVFSQSSCGVCARVIFRIQECSFCEKKLCENCIMTCRKCNQHFCSLCIFSVYEENEECSICRTCY